MKIIQLIILGLIICSCNNGSKKKDVNLESETETIKTEKEIVKNLDPKFATYLNKIDTLSLPQNIACFDLNKYELYENYKHLIDTTFSSEEETPYRRIKTNAPYEIVVYLAPADILIPIVKTFSLEGKEISTLQLFTNCGGEPGFKARQFVEIQNNRRIVHIDSTWTWEVDEEYKEIDSTEKIKVTRTTYRIEKSGFIKKEESTVHNTRS